MEQPLVEMTDLSVRYRSGQGLGPISMAVRPGEFWGVIGPNGAGKSTLLRTLAGMQPFASGRLHTLGHSLDPGSRRPVCLRRNAALLFQSHEYSPDLPFTVEDVVMFGRIAHAGSARRYRRADYEAVRDAIDRLGLRELCHRLYRDLSGGQQRKVHLARMVAHQPRLLLLDEPAAGLDLDWQDRLTRLVEDLFIQTRTTVIMVTHDVDHLPPCCTRVLLLKNGKPLAAGPPDELLCAETLSRLYGCRMEVVRREGRIHVFSLGTGDAS